MLGISRLESQKLVEWRIPLLRRGRTRLVQPPPGSVANRGRKRLRRNCRSLTPTRRLTFIAQLPQVLRKYRGLFESSTLSPRLNC